MKRIIIALLLAIVVMMTMGTSVVLAKGPHDSIVVHAGSGRGPTFDLAATDGVPPPEVTIIKPDGTIMRPRPFIP